MPDQRVVMTARRATVCCLAAVLIAIAAWTRIGPDQLVSASITQTRSDAEVDRWPPVATFFAFPERGTACARRPAAPEPDRWDEAAGRHAKW